MLNANLISVGTGKRAKKPKRYERPIETDNTKKLGGKGTLSHDKMVVWIEQRRKDARDRVSNKHEEEKADGRND